MCIRDSVEPLAAVEVKVLGVMAIVVVPLVTQLRVLLEPDVMLVGLAVKELMVGLLGGRSVSYTHLDVYKRQVQGREGEPDRR